MTTINSIMNIEPIDINDNADIAYNADNADEYLSANEYDTDEEIDEVDEVDEEVEENIEENIIEDEGNQHKLNIRSNTFTIESPQYKNNKYKLLGNPSYDNSSYSTYHIIGGEKTNMFCKNIKTYGSNLLINREHCKNIETELLIEDSPLIYAEFSVVEYEQHETNDKTTLLELLDGHHRRLALKNIFKKYPNFKIDIRVCVIKSDFPDSPQTKKLFRKFNILKPFDVNFDIMEVANIIINNLSDTFNSRISNFVLIKDTQSSVYKPSIKKSIINDYIQKRLETLKNSNHINANDINIDAIIKNFQRYNNKFLKQNIEWFKSNLQFGIGSTITQNMIDKAKKANCFIGLVNLKSLVKCCIGENYN